MTAKLWIALALGIGSLGLSACAPAVVGAAAVGVTGAVIADKAVEEEQGGDGLF